MIGCNAFLKLTLELHTSRRIVNTSTAGVQWTALQDSFMELEKNYVPQISAVVKYVKLVIPPPCWYFDFALERVSISAELTFLAFIFYTHQGGSSCKSTSP